MSEIWRVIDSGLRQATQNIALDRALLEARHADEIPSTLRFLRYAPSALLGCQQSAAQELSLDYCTARAISVQRRITGGGVLLTNEHQFDWSLYLHRRDVGDADLRDIGRRISHAVATAVSATGVAARFRPPCDVVVDSARVACGGYAVDGDALLFQGTLQFTDACAEMPGALRVSADGYPDDSCAAALPRSASLKSLLGRRANRALMKRLMTEAFESEFDAEFQDGELTLSEHSRYRTALAAIETKEWTDLVHSPASDAPFLEATHACAGGQLRIRLLYDRPGHRIRQVRFGGAIDARPGHMISDLEAALQGTSVERIEHNVLGFFTGHSVEMALLQPADFIAALRLATRQPLVAPHRN